MNHENKDYENGIKLLVIECKKQGINYHSRKLKWLTKFSRMLSEHGLCYKFWYNTVNQSRLKNIKLCDYAYETCYENDEKILFYWAKTKEGVSFWDKKLEFLWNTDSFHSEKLLFIKFNDSFWE